MQVEERISHLETDLVELKSDVKHIKKELSNGVTSKLNATYKMLQDFITEYKCNPFHNPETAPKVHDVHGAIQFTHRFWSVTKWVLISIVGFSVGGTIARIITTHLVEKAIGKG